MFLCSSTIGEHIHTKLPFDLSILAVNLFERDLRRTSKHDCSWLLVTYLFIYLDMPSVRCDCVMIGYRLRKHASNLVTLKAAWAAWVKRKRILRFGWFSGQSDQGKYCASCSLPVPL